MPETATAASPSWSSVGLRGLELADEPGDLTGGDAGADREAADLLDDEGHLAEAVGAGRLHGGFEREPVRLLGERDDRGDEMFGAIWIRAEAGHTPDIGRLSQAGVRRKSRSGQGPHARDRVRALAHPVQLGGESVLQARRGSEAQLAPARVGVGAGVLHVAVLAVGVADVERAARDPGQDLERAAQARAVPAADVVDAAGRRVEASPAARVAATMSPTNVKSRVWRPSP